MSAFAQSSVTVSGNFDVAYSSLVSQTAGADKADIVGNGSSTSIIKISGVEDLGGGLKAVFSGVNTISAVSPQTGNGTSPYYNGNFFNDELFVGLEGGFGALKLGAPAAGLYETNGKSHPYGTSLGGGYSSSGINRLLGQTTTLGMNAYLNGASSNGRVIRAEKSLRYDTPVMNGLSANYVFAPQNANSSTATSNTNGFSNLTFNFSQGPLVLAYSTAKITSGANAAATTTGFNTYTDTGTGSFTPAFTATANALSTNANVRYTFLAGNYTIGSLTIYGGATTGKTAGLSANYDVSSSNVALKYAASPMVDIYANLVSVKDNSATTPKDQSLAAMSVIYKFSKLTSAYITYQTYDTDKSSGTLGEVKQTLFGLRQQF